MDDKFFLRRATTGEGAFSPVVPPGRAGWPYGGRPVLELGPGGTHTWPTGDDELLVLPRSGSAVVICDGQSIGLAGRRDVLSRLSDFCYAPRNATVAVASAVGRVFAVPSPRCTRRLSARYGPAEDVPVELRGAGQTSQQANDFCSPEAFECDKLIAVEVLTPGGNWSSYPPRKHDQASAGEVELEEIYNFETGGLAYQRVCGTASRPVDVLAEVAAGDVVLIPHGWRGLLIAAPGYDLYYLNVMASPADERAWRLRDDPVHAWIRDTWGRAGGRRPPAHDLSGRPRGMT